MTSSPPAQAAAPNRQYTREVANVASGVDLRAGDFDPALLQYEETGDFFGLLETQPYSLIVTREYEHFALTLDGAAGRALQSPFPLPHPSGMWFDEAERELIVSSTRTPNLIVWMSPFTPSAHASEILPADYAGPGAGETVFLPRKALYLPGTLYIHDVVKMAGEIYATITGHNFLARLSLDGGWERVWWPNALDGLGNDAFNQNFFQLNSIAVNTSPQDSFYTAFSDLVTGPKPWKGGYGPEGKGVIFSGATRAPILRGLTCPHAAKLHEGKLWVCNSGHGEIGYVENFESLDEGATRFVPIARAPGFTRGMIFAGDYVFVGLSKVIPQYEPYAPGLKSAETECGIQVFNHRTGAFVASIRWPNGYQIYDVQKLDGVKQPRLPLASRESDGINPLLRFLS